MPKLSVVVPIYNVEQYLKKCLDSIVNQTLADIEIICVNDGSTDNSLDIINEYAKNDNRIVVINKKNSGLGAAYNSGLEIAKGEYIGFVEPDDYISPNMYEELYNCTYCKPDFVKSDYFQVKDNTVTRANLFKGFTSKNYKSTELQILMFRVLSHWSAIYKKAFLEKYDIKYSETPGASYQDIGFARKAYFCADNIYLKNEPYYFYRIHENQSIAQNDVKHLFIALNEYKLLMHYIQKNQAILTQEKYDIFNKTVFNALIWNYKNRGNNSCFEFIKQFSLILNNNMLQQCKNNSLNYKETFVYNLIKRHYVIAFMYLKFYNFFKLIRILNILLK